ncbi:MAG TPA: carboxypeptidase-like regulatory domain-containing protein [Polyangiaceae bacterium]|nr:carboxypeptidase-like regulatory domain-containing protein [Polyangiaceae bacterium]
MACAFCADCDLTHNGSDPVCDAPDQGGRYVLLGIRPADYHVSLIANGHRPRIANRSGPIRLRDKDVDLGDTELDEGGAQVTGTVSDATGGPVIGATIRATFSLDELPPGRLFTAITKSGDAGSFTMTVPEGHLLLVAAADGYAEDRTGAHAPLGGVRLVLTPASRISGTVVASTGQSAVPGVRVTAHGAVGFEQVATSDIAGAFTLVGLPPGTYSLEASGDGWKGRRSGTVTLDVNDSARDVTVPVVKAMHVTGAVRVGEAPCGSGVVSLMPAPGENLPQVTSGTDISGHVRFEAVPPGRYRSNAQCTGYGVRHGPDVQVEAADVDGVVWTFEKGVDVTVRASTPTGVAVAGTTVVLTHAAAGDASVTSRSSRTNDDGTAQILGLPEGRYVVAGPDIDQPLDVVLTASSAPIELAVTTKAIGGIDVVVKDAQGHPNEQIAVMYHAAGGPFGGMGLGEPHGGGLYRIGRLPAGDYRVELQDGVNPVLQVGGADGVVHVASGEVSRVEATYGGHSGRIRGRVLSSDGMPIENVWVSAQPSGTGRNGVGQMLMPVTHASSRRSLTNVEGRFVLDGLLETGSFAVVASHALGGEARVEGVAVGQDVEIRMSVPGRIAGVVLDEGGRPASHFQIAIDNQDRTQRLTAEFGPESQGKWFVDHVAPGTIEIRAQGGDGAASLFRDLAPAQRVEDIELRLQPAASAKN